MDLETYRSAAGLTYNQLAELLHVSTARQAQRYAIGANWPGAEPLQRILDVCDGVTIDAMHERRLQFVRESQGRDQPGAKADARAV